MVEASGNASESGETFERRRKRSIRHRMIRNIQGRLPLLDGQGLFEFESCHGYVDYSRLLLGATEMFECICWSHKRIICCIKIYSSSSHFEILLSSHSHFKMSTNKNTATAPAATSIPSSPLVANDVDFLVHLVQRQFETLAIREESHVPSLSTMDILSMMLWSIIQAEKWVPIPSPASMTKQQFQILDFESEEEEFKVPIEHEDDSDLLTMPSHSDIDRYQKYIQKTANKIGMVKDAVKSNPSDEGGAFGPIFQAGKAIHFPESSNASETPGTDSVGVGEQTEQEIHDDNVDAGSAPVCQILEKCPDKKQYDPKPVAPTMNFKDSDTSDESNNADKSVVVLVSKSEVSADNYHNDDLAVAAASFEVSEDGDQKHSDVKDGSGDASNVAQIVAALPKLDAAESFEDRSDAAIAAEDPNAHEISAGEASAEQKTKSNKQVTSAQSEVAAEDQAPAQVHLANMCTQNGNVHVIPMPMAQVSTKRGHDAEDDQPSSKRWRGIQVAEESDGDASDTDDADDGSLRTSAASTASVKSTDPIIALRPIAPLPSRRGYYDASRDPRIRREAERLVEILAISTSLNDPDPQPAPVRVKMSRSRGIENLEDFERAQYARRRRRE
jgi:hypothetical protein